jgi:hypothetical protein
MKLKHILPCAATVFLSASATFAQTTIARWTFETSEPGVVTLPATPGASVWLTNIMAEIGSGTAAGWHSGFGTPTYSSPTGNGSAHSFSANGWTNNPNAASGDLFQFAVSTVGYQHIVVSWDQYGSSTGPKHFNLLYSTDGVNFTQFGSTYNVLGAPTWSASTATTLDSYTNDLSSITAINNSTVVYFRLVVVDNGSVGGATVGTTGTSRVDNFTVIGTSPGAPSITAPPQNLSVYKGDSASFSVTAGGTAPLAYQWYYTNSSGVVKLVDGPSGYGVGAITNSSTNASVTFTYVDPAQAGGYFVIVTNSIGSITSSVASLTVGIRTPISTTIYAIRTNQTANWFPVDTTNLYTVTGTVYTLFNMTAATSREFFIEDASGEGISVFVGGGTFLPNQGDSVTVTGPIGQFDGLLEFKLDASNPTHSLTDNSSGNPLPAPKSFDINSLTNIAFVETNVEGSLIVVSNVFLQQPEVAGFVSAADVVMTNANGVKLNLFVNAGASDVIASSVPPFASSISGVFDQYTSSSPATNSYEVDILQYAGLVAGSPVTANPDSYSMASNTMSLFPVLANDTVLSPLFEGTLTVSAVSTTNGTAAVDGTGTNITFTPDTDFVGTLTIGYTATDTAGYSGNGVDTVTVTNVPPGPTTIVPTVSPGITGIGFVNGNLVITGTNAQATGVYYLLESTNVALPLSQWTPVATNVVSTDNGFTFTGTNVVTTGAQEQFYILSSTNYQ